MDILEEVGFYEKYLALKKEKGYGWQVFGDILEMTPDAIRVAFKRGSLKDYEISLIEQYFDSGSKPSKDGLNVEEIMQHPLVEKEIELRALRKAFCWMQNPDKFKE